MTIDTTVAVRPAKRQQMKTRVFVSADLAESTELAPLLSTSAPTSFEARVQDEPVVTTLLWFPTLVTTADPARDILATPTDIAMIWYKHGCHYEHHTTEHKTRGKNDNRKLLLALASCSPGRQSATQASRVTQCSEFRVWCFSFVEGCTLTWAHSVCHNMFQRRGSRSEDQTATTTMLKL